jgi:hypothetical protein
MGPRIVECMVGCSAPRQSFDGHVVQESVESLFLAATCRTRSSALGTPVVRHCVRDVFCRSVFSLVSPLPSTTSATVFSALFDDFVSSMGLSDFP